MVISALTSSKFYRLPPDRENPGNIVNCTSWENRGQRGVKCESCNCQEKLFAYGKTKPLERTFQSEIYCEESEGRFMDDLTVFEGQEKAFIGKSTAEKLSVLRIGPPNSPEAHSIKGEGNSVDIEKNF